MRKEFLEKKHKECVNKLDWLYKRGANDEKLVGRIRKLKTLINNL